MSSRILVATIVAVGFAFLVACGGSTTNTSPVAPSQSAGIDRFVGGWAATTGGGTGTGPCTKLNYEITKLSTDSASVSYDATCSGYDIKGTGQSTLTGSTLKWSAAGTVSGNGISCPFEFKDSTATPQGNDALLVTYNVTVCGIGPISGSQTLQRTH